jgi:hypothetical protein
VFIKIRWLAALGLASVAGCATCRECGAVEPRPTAQASAQADDAATPPPKAPRFTAPPAEEDLPPLPVPTPPAPETRKKSGRIVRTTRTEVEGEATIIEQHAPGTIIVGSPGANAPAAAPVVAAVQPQSYPVLPVPVPDSLILAAARRVGGGLYYAVTGQCPPPRAQRYEAVVPVTEVRYQRVPLSVQAAPVPAAAPVVFAAPSPPPAAAPQPQAFVAPSPQAPHKKWFGFGR